MLNYSLNDILIPDHHKINKNKNVTWKDPSIIKIPETFYDCVTNSLSGSASKTMISLEF